MAVHLISTHREHCRVETTYSCAATVLRGNHSLKKRVYLLCGRPRLGDWQLSRSSRNLPAARQKTVWCAPKLYACHGTFSVARQAPDTTRRCTYFEVHHIVVRASSCSRGLLFLEIVADHHPTCAHGCQVGRRS